MRRTHCASVFLNPAIMRYCLFSIFCVVITAPLRNLANPLASPWDRIRVKHTWDDVPPNWESLGLPPAGTTINLNIILVPHNKDALIDALYEVSDPNSSKHVLFKTLPRTMFSHVSCSAVDMVHTYHKSMSLSLSRHTKTRWSSYIPGLEIMTCRPLPSR